MLQNTLTEIEYRLDILRDTKWRATYSAELIP
jgi:hypothetical protein